MAEITPGPVQYLGQITGVDQQLGAGATYPHPLGAQPLTKRWVGRVHFRAAAGNGAESQITNKTSAGTAVRGLLPAESYEFIVYNPGERYRLGDFFVNTSGADYVEVFYVLR